MGVSKFYRFLILSFISISLFQNCLPSEIGDDKKEVSSPSQNGAGVPLEAGEIGYEGKVNYGSRNFDKNCDDGNEAFSKIVVDPVEKSAVMTRNNCQAIDPIKIDYQEVDLMPHNLDNFAADLRVYERYKDKMPPGQMFSYCRGSAQDQGTGIVVVDAIVKDLGEQTYQARVVAGKYDTNGNLLSTYDSGMVSVYRWATEKAPQTAYYTYKDESGARHWFIKIESGYETKGVFVFDKPDFDYSDWGSIHGFPCLRFME